MYIKKIILQREKPFIERLSFPLTLVYRIMITAEALKMNNFSENELKYCLDLRRKLFEVSKSLVNCDLEERKLYEKLYILLN